MSVYLGSKEIKSPWKPWTRMPAKCPTCTVTLQYILEPCSSVENNSLANIKQAPWHWLWETKPLSSLADASGCYVTLSQGDEQKIPQGVQSAVWMDNGCLLSGLLIMSLYITDRRGDGGWPERGQTKPRNAHPSVSDPRVSNQPQPPRNSVPPLELHHVLFAQ